MIRRDNPNLSFANDRSEISDLLFREKQVPYHKAMIDKIVLDKQPYDYNPLSPTPLDPFHLTTAGPDYYHAALIYMERRLDDVASRHNIPDDVKDVTMHEIEVEHEHRSHKNNGAMRELRKAYPEDSMIERETANDIFTARAAIGTLGKLALLLANNPTMGGIEVIKDTEPFDIRKILIAHATFIALARRTEAQNEDKFSIVGGKIGLIKPRPVDTTSNVGPNVFAFKGKEADIDVNGTRLELISRYSYVTLGDTVDIKGIEPIWIPTKNSMINVQPISMTKYLRIPKQD